MKLHCFTIQCLLAFATAALAAEPLRVAVAPAGYYDTLGVPERYSIPLLLHLRDRFEEMPDVLLADADWAGALLGEFVGGKRNIDAASLFTEFTARLPVDALVRVTADSNELQCIVLTAQGERTKSIPLSKKPAVQEVCETAAAHVASVLKLSTGDTQIQTERRVKNPALFEALLLARRVSVRYPNSIAEARMTLLQKFAGTPDSIIPAYAVSVVEGLRTISNGRATSASAVQRGVDISKKSVLHLLGTPFEERAHPILRELSTAFEADLLALVNTLSSNALDLALDGGKGRKEGGLLSEAGGGSSAGQVTLEQRLGALRCLGVIESDKALAIIRLVAKNEESVFRQAAPEALRHYSGQTGLDLLRALAGDADSKVAFAASHGLWKRGQSSASPIAAPKKKILPAVKPVVAPSDPALSTEETRVFAERALKLARQFADDKDAARRAAAREVVCALGTREDVVQLTMWSESNAAAMRAPAVEALVRLKAVDQKRWPALLKDSSVNVLAAALQGVPTDVQPSLVKRMSELANDPLASVAQAASMACARYRPAEPRARLMYDLAVEHPYIRCRLIDRLAADSSPAATEDLATACTNSEPHARTHALKRLAERDPSLARAALAKAITDPYHWVRLHAAAQLAGMATASETDAILKAQGTEQDPATRLYLADALAKAGGKPAPTGAAAALQVAGKTNLTWSCGAGEGCETSPFGAYYLLGVDSINERLQRAHAAGKIIFARATPIGNAGTIITDRSAMDGFWLSLQAELATGSLPHLDGVVYGEETMTATTEPLWKNGWPLFCFDAGIDPEKIRGLQSNLSPPEARAWSDWALTQTVEGFNALYDYTKLRFGKLRPGLQVCTFMPGQGATGPADRRWKFDVGGIYDYKGNNRIAAYTLIRRMKTLWPERPVLWLSLGIGGYEMNPVKYTQKTPDAPLTNRSDRAYADSVTAWLAGADTGWFSTWMFIGANDKAAGLAQLKGLQIVVEDIAPDSKKLKSGITYSFASVDKLYTARTNGVAPKIDDESRAEKLAALAVDDLLSEKKTVVNPILKQIDQEKERMRIGFQFYGKYVYDCARVFASLPRLDPKPEVLAVKPGLTVWSRAADFSATAHNLLNAYDFLLDVNQLVEADLPRYRLIAVDGLDDAPLSDRTITKLSGWLKEQPGLLYVRGSLSTSATNEASTAADHDGVLKEHWPWAGQVEYAPSKTDSKYVVSGSNAKILKSGAQGPVLVLWRTPDGKGAVLFDSGFTEAADLKDTINKLTREQKIGLELTGPSLQTAWQQDGVFAAATSGGSVANALAGIDLLAGLPNPSVGHGRSGAMVFTNLIGKYAASLNGVAVLGESPIKDVASVPNGLRVQCAGLLQAGGQSGAVTVTTEGGASLPMIESAKVIEWILSGKEDGICTLPIAESPGSKTTYIRSSKPVVVSSKVSR